MATTVTLKVKDGQGNVTNKQHVIEDITLFQFEEVMGVIKEIIRELQVDSSLSEVVTELFDGELMPGENEADEIAKDSDVLLKLANSYETLAMKMPGHAFRLLSVMSGIDLTTLKQQKLNEAFDIFDAVIEENDIERLVNRIKKSLTLTAAKTKFLQLARKATAPIASAISK